MKVSHVVKCIEKSHGKNPFGGAVRYRLNRLRNADMVMLREKNIDIMTLLAGYSRIPLDTLFGETEPEKGATMYMDDDQAYVYGANVTESEQYTTPYVNEDMFTKSLINLAKEALEEYVAEHPERHLCYDDENECYYFNLKLDGAKYAAS